MPATELLFAECPKRIWRGSDGKLLRAEGWRLRRVGPKWTEKGALIEHERPNWIADDRGLQYAAKRNKAAKAALRTLERLVGKHGGPKHERACVLLREYLIFTHPNVQ